MPTLLSDADVGLELTDADVGLSSPVVDLTPQSGPISLAQPGAVPQMPSTTAGGPPVPMASYAETMSSVQNDASGLWSRTLAPNVSPHEPRVVVPDLPMPSQAPVTAAESLLLGASPIARNLDALFGPNTAATVLRQGINQVGNLGEFMTSDFGLATIPAATVAPTAVSGFFTVDMAKALGNQGLDLWNRWDQMTPEQRAVALTDMGATGAMLLTAGAHFKNRLRKAADAVNPQQPPPVIPPATTTGATLPPRPGAPAPRTEPTPIERATPEQAAAQAEAMTQRAGEGVKPVETVNEQPNPVWILNDEARGSGWEKNPFKTWQEWFDKESEIPRKNDILQAVVKRSKSDAELSDVVDRAQGMLGSDELSSLVANTLYDVAQKPFASDATRSKAMAAHDEVYKRLNEKPSEPDAPNRTAETAVDPKVDRTQTDKPVTLEKVEPKAPSLGELSPDEAAKQGVDYADYRLAVEQAYRDEKISEAQFIERTDKADAKAWPKFKVGQDVYVTGQYRGPAKVTDVGSNWIEVQDPSGTKSRQTNYVLEDLGSYKKRHPEYFKQEPAQVPPQPAVAEGVKEPVKVEEVAPTTAEPTSAVVASRSREAVELPELSKADVKSDPRNEEPGITKQSKPNSLIVTIRDLESYPVKDIVLESTGDPILDSQKAYETIIKETNTNGNWSRRESGAVTTGPNGRAVLRFATSPNGMTWASAKEWLDLIESGSSKPNPVQEVAKPAVEAKAPVEKGEPVSEAVRQGPPPARLGGFLGEPASSFSERLGLPKDFYEFVQTGEGFEPGQKTGYHQVSDKYRTKELDAAESALDKATKGRMPTTQQRKRVEEEMRRIAERVKISQPVGSAGIAELGRLADPPAYGLKNKSQVEPGVKPDIGQAEKQSPPKPTPKPVEPPKAVEKVGQKPGSIETEMVNTLRDSLQQQRDKVSAVRYGKSGEILFEYDGKTYSAKEPSDVMPAVDAKGTNAEASRSWALKQVLDGKATEVKSAPPKPTPKPVEPPKAVEKVVEDVYEVDFESPSGGRSTVRVSQRKYSDLSPEMQKLVDQEHQATLAHNEKEFRTWDKVKSGKAKVTHWERVNDDGTRSEHISLESPETEFANWATRTDIYDKKLNAKGEQLRQKVEAKKEAKAKADEEAKAAEQKVREQENAEWKAYESEVLATPLPKGKKGTIEVPGREGGKVSLTGTAYGDFFIDKRGGKWDDAPYNVTHIRSGLGVSRSGFATLEQAKNYVKALIHGKVDTKWSLDHQLTAEARKRWGEVANAWRDQKAPPKPTTAPATDIPQGPGATPKALAAPPIRPSAAPPKVPPVLAPKDLSQIIRDLSKGLNVPIRFRNMPFARVAGYFKAIPNIIGTKKAVDLPVVTHEIGHKLDMMFKISSDPTIAAELMRLGDPTTAGSASSWKAGMSNTYKLGEGVAEFMRRWIEDPHAAIRDWPNTATYVEAMLRRNPEVESVIRQAQSDIQLWKDADPQLRFRAHIVRGENPVKPRLTYNQIMRAVVNDYRFLDLFSRAAERGLGRRLYGREHPHELAQALVGTYGRAKTFIEDGVIDFKTGQVIEGTGLKTILAPIRNRFIDFSDWITAKRAQELHRQGKATGFVPEDTDAVVAKFDGDPVFQKAFEGIKQWNRALIDYAVDAGFLSPDARDAWLKMHEDYVPFHRFMEVGAGELAAVEGSGAGRGLNVGTPGSFRKLVGSERPVIDPLETMIKNAYSILHATEKNLVNLAVANQVDTPGMGKWISRASLPAQPIKFSAKEIAKKLEDAGADLSAIPDLEKLALEIYRPKKEAPQGENIIKVNRAGQVEYYHVSPDLYETFLALDTEVISRVIRAASIHAQVLRSGVTMNPDFPLSNVFRDSINAAIVSRHGVIPFVNAFRGLFHILGSTKEYKEWAAAGGKQSVEADFFDAAKMFKYVRENLAKDKGPWAKTVTIVKSPLEALRRYNAAFDNVNRMGVYTKTYNDLIRQGVPEADARRSAAYEARDLQNFGMGGSHTKSLRMLTPFWNAMIQGNYKFMRAMKERPVTTTAKALAYITLPTLIEQAINFDDPDYWELPKWRRYGFWHIPFGKDENGRTKFLAFPNPFLQGTLFSSAARSVAEWYKTGNRSEAFRELANQLRKDSIPNAIPPSIVTFLELTAGEQGWSFWRDRPIVPNSLKDDAPELQYTEQNTLAARKLGKMLGWSPAKIDYFIGATMGGAAKLVLHQGVDRVIEAMTGEKRTAKNVSLGGRFFAPPAGVQSNSIERFYKLLEKARKDKSLLDANGTDPGLASYAPALEAAAKNIADIRRETRGDLSDKEKQMLNIEAAELARETVEAIEASRLSDR